MIEASLYAYVTGVPLAVWTHNVTAVWAAVWRCEPSTTKLPDANVVVVLRGVDHNPVAGSNEVS